MLGNHSQSIFTHAHSFSQVDLKTETTTLDVSLGIFLALIVGDLVFYLLLGVCFYLFRKRVIIKTLIWCPWKYLAHNISFCCFLYLILQ